MRLDAINIYQLSLPLLQPYKLSHKVISEFNPILIEIGADGECGWGEAQIDLGYTAETYDTGWAFARELARAILGKEPQIARRTILARAASSPTVASGLLSALDMLERDELLEIGAEARVPILVPCQAEGAAAIRDEVQELAGRGFSTFKVKVGFDVETDLERVSAIQRAADGRATLRLDANRGYDRTQGCVFASRLDPEGIELLEQPCEADAWEDNAAVAAVSTVPVMLDESIHVLEDIDRAAGIKGVRYVKVKLKKMGGVRALKESLDRIRRLGMRPVLGDGVSVEISAWMEACVARSTIDNAGEMNGFLKTSERLFDEPLPFANGSVLLAPGYRPRIDRKAVLRHALRSERL